MVITPSTASGPPPSKMEAFLWEQGENKTPFNCRDRHLRRVILEWSVSETKDLGGQTKRREQLRAFSRGRRWQPKADG